MSNSSNSGPYYLDQTVQRKLISTPWSPGRVRNEMNQ